MAIVSFLTDFGTEDVYVGVVKAVMLAINPHLMIVDLTHHVPPQDVGEGAFQLMAAASYFPSGATHLAVVDPGVGTQRRLVAVRTAAQTFVGPDNGLLSFALRREARAEGVEVRESNGTLSVPSSWVAVELNQPRFWQHPVSSTFHARDVFGPVAAHLASGASIEQVGTAVDSVIALGFPEAQRQPDGVVVGQVVHVDRFGNLVTNVPAGMLSDAVRVEAGKARISRLSHTYGVGSGLVALVGSAGFLELAVPGGSAARELGLNRGDLVRVLAS